MSIEHKSFSDQFEKNTGLKIWVQWFTTATIVSTFIFIGYVSEEKIYGNISLLNFGIYSSIFIVALMAIGTSFKDARFIDKQSKLATQQVKKLLHLNDVSEFLDSVEDSIFKNHIDNLYSIFRVHSTINQDNLIEILHSRLLARNKNVELLSGVLITLGLIGTIIGLIDMTNRLGRLIGEVGEADPAQVMQQIAGNDGPLGSLGIAFYTTLLGAVFGGVLLRVLANIVQSSISMYTAHVAELTEVYVLPSMRKLATNLESAGYYAGVDS